MVAVLCSFLFSWQGGKCCEVAGETSEFPVLVSFALSVQIRSSQDSTVSTATITSRAAMLNIFNISSARSLRYSAFQGPYVSRLHAQKSTLFLGARIVGPG
ncbi:uncharacterized protein BJX67DRAFT_40526 [Aspergillus lucknowensis]|uniref:Secreted protein n=1 Tax=Aspergillus lucknowensis TaxID=176173 RepID=A0ABR4LZS4_9EURO